MRLGNILWVLLFLFAVKPASAQETLILTTSGHPPFHTTEETGFVDAVMQEVFGRLNIKARVVRLPGERALINANSGIDDGDAYRIAGLEKVYPNLIQVPGKITSQKFVAFATEIDFPTKGWKSLKPYSVGYINGWKIFEHNVTEAAQITKVKNPAQLFDLLINNRANVVLFDAWQGLALLKESKIKGVKILQPPFAEKDMFLYLHKKHQHLVPKVAASLRAMKVDGTYQRLIDKLLTPLAAN